jgi:hypothetical protein
MLAPTALALAIAAPFGTYDVEAGPGGRELAVEARFKAGAGERLQVRAQLAPFIVAPQVWRAGGWHDAERVNGDIVTPRCSRTECRVRYRVQLEAAARKLASRSSAFVNGEALLAVPSTWLLEPALEPELQMAPAVPDGAGALAPNAARYHVRVRTPPGTTFVTGLFRVRGTPDTYAVNTIALGPYSGFGAFTVRTVTAGGGSVEVAIAPDARAPSADAVRAWVQRCASAVAAYYGRAPLPRYAVIVLAGSRQAVGFGTAMGYGGGAILVWVSAHASARDLARSWVLVHEMVHLGFPNVPGRQNWMEEGLATYVEEVARVRAGWISGEEFWSDLRAGFPKGLLMRTESGLNDARRWGPLYWGGALFWFLADVELRERTGGAKGLEDALRGVLGKSGGIAAWWPPEKVVEAADAATGTRVLRDLYDRFGRAYLDVDLDAQWARLDARPAIKKAITGSP